MKVRRRPADEVGLQIAPMCDVVFLILTFFMLTTRMTQHDPAPPVRLPLAATASEADARDRFTITLDARGRFFLGAEPVEPEALRQRLRARFQERPPLRVTLRADAATPARAVKEAIAWSAEAGAAEVMLGATTNANADGAEAAR